MRGPTLKLYGHVDRLSPNSLKLRVALHEVDAVYEYIPVDLDAGEHLRPSFLALNPHGKIPVLLEDDFALPESDAILYYLADRFPEAKLLGSSPRDRGRALRWCNFTATGLSPAARDVYFHEKGGPEARRVPALAERGRRHLDRAIGVLDQALADGGYLAGEFGIADIATAAVLRKAIEQLPFDLAPHPAIEAWYQRVTARPSWKNAAES